MSAGHPPSLSDTRSGPFSRTTDGVTPVELPAPPRATHRQRIYTSGPQSDGARPSLAKASIDEGVELEGSENSYEMLAGAPTSAAKTTNLLSFSSSGGSSDVASFDSTTDAEMMTAQTTPPWVFTSGESLSSATGLDATSPAENPTESFRPTKAVEDRVVGGACRLAVPAGPSNMLQVPPPDVRVDGENRDGFFHSGRRASDGLATRADILQLQQLMKSRGVAELQKELQLLPVPADPLRPADPPSRGGGTPQSRRGARPIHQRSFEDGSPGRRSPLGRRRSRQPTAAMRPRLAALGRSRQPPPSKSPLAELTTLCRMTDRTRSPERRSLYQQFQQLGLDGRSSPHAAFHLPSTSGLIPHPVALAACVSDQRLAAAPSPQSEVPSCRSRDSIHPVTTTESVAVGHVPAAVGQLPAAVGHLPAAGGHLPATVGHLPPDDGCSASVRRHMVRRTLYRLVHQQTLISSFGEEDIPEVSPLSEQASDTAAEASAQCSSGMDVT